MGVARRSELRDYTIQAGRLTEFVAAWRGGVLPLRRAFGFTIDGAWVVPEQERFVWILSFDGAGTFEERDAAYYASPERKALRPDPAQWIARGDHVFLEPVGLT